MTDRSFAITTKRALMFVRMADYMTRNGLDPSLRISDVGKIYDWITANGIPGRTALNYTTSLMNWLELSKEEREKTELAFLIRLLPNIGRTADPERGAEK